MKNIGLYILTIVLIFSGTLFGLKACDYEAEQNEIKQRQWVQDSKDGRPFTNFGE